MVQIKQAWMQRRAAYLAILGQGECCGKKRIACESTNLYCPVGIHDFQKHR
jgi:hypothetical protein